MLTRHRRFSQMYQLRGRVDHAWEFEEPASTAILDAHRGVVGVCWIAVLTFSTLARMAPHFPPFIPIPIFLFSPPPPPSLFQITCLVYAPPDLIVSGSDDNTLRVWSLANPSCLRTLSGHSNGVWCCAVEGNLVVSGSCDRTLRVWNLHTGRCLHTLYGHASTVRCVRVSKGFAVTGSRDNTIRLWNVVEGTHLLTLEGHRDTVR
jgi:WD40 repeat protein